MKKMIFAAMILASPAFAGESCLTKDETQMLNDIRSGLMMAKFKRPDCTRLRGAGACLLPADQANLQYLERKEQGEAKACGLEKKEDTEE